MLFRSLQDADFSPFGEDRRKPVAPSMDKLYIVMPVYNEAANLRRTVADWYPLTQLGDDSRLLLIDDGSKDDSLRIMEELTAHYPKLEMISKVNEGHGPTIRRAYAEALGRGADYVFQTDSDGQTRPEEFTQLWNDRTHFGAQIGARTGRQDGLQRRLVSLVLRVLLLLFFGVWTQDPNTPFRLFDRAALARFLPLIPEDFALTNSLLSVYVGYTKINARYVPITFLPRQGGKNSINFSRIVSIARETVSRFPSLNRAMRGSLRKQGEVR